MFPSEQKQHSYVIIDNPDVNSIKSAFKQWLGLYTHELPDGMTFVLFEVENARYGISISETIENQFFFFLVNYLKFPENMETMKDVVGYTTGNSNIDLFGVDIMVYNSTDASEFDCVYITSLRNVCFKWEFSDDFALVECRRSYQLPEPFHPVTIETFVVKNEIENQKGIHQNDLIRKRFNVISAIVLAFYSIVPLLNIHSLDRDMTIYVGSYFVAGWLLFDYTLLRIRKYYLLSVGLCLVILAIGIFLTRTPHLDNTNELLLIGVFSPLSILMLQLPARKLFLLIMKREPIVERPAPTMSDALYSMFLFFGGYGLPFIIVFGFLQDIWDK